jgi:hypothetical protein
MNPMRTLEIEKRINMLTEDIGKISISNSARKMLLYIPGFEDINISDTPQRKSARRTQKYFE